MAPYWPQPEEGSTLIHRFDSGRFGLYRRQGDHFTLDDAWHRYTDPDDAEHLLLSGTWHYRIDPSRGMLEFQDDTPGKASTPLARGYELHWGLCMRIGQTLEHKVMFEGARAPFGYHRLTLVARFRDLTLGPFTYADVIQLHDLQIVCRDSTASEGSQDARGPLDCPKTGRSHATLLLARGLGIVRIEDSVLDGVPGFMRVETVVRTCRMRSRPGSDYCR